MQSVTSRSHLLMASTLDLPNRQYGDVLQAASSKAALPPSRAVPPQAPTHTASHTLTLNPAPAETCKYGSECKFSHNDGSTNHSVSRMTCAHNQSSCNSATKILSKCTRSVDDGLQDDPSSSPCMMHLLCDAYEGGGL